ncbi:hypothetical protein Tco_0228931 [Tanacetum coccineum]
MHYDVTPSDTRFLLGPIWGCDRLVSRAKVLENQFMAAPIISISSESSEKSVGSHAPRVILFGAIPAIIPIILKVPIVLTNPYSYTRCGDSFSRLTCQEADSESELAEQRPERHESLAAHDAMVSRWRDRVASRPSPSSRSSSHDTLAPSSKFPLAPVVDCEDECGPIPARRLAWRRVSHHSSDRHSSPDSSSSSSPSDHSLSGHTPPDTIDSDTSTPPRFIHLHLFLDHLASRSPTASVPSPTYVSRLIALTPANLLPPRKRFRDSYSPEDSGEEHMEVDTADAEAVADVDISNRVVAHTENSVGMGVEITTSDVREDDEEFKAEASAADTREITVDPLAIGDSSESFRGGIPDLEDTVYDIVHYMLEEEFRQVRRDRDDTQRRLRRTMTITCSGMTPKAIEELVNRRMEEALAAYEEARAANALEAENQSQNGNDGDNGNGGNGNGRNGNGGNRNPNENGRGDRHVAKECTYQDFMKCQPLNFKGMKGVEMETVFHISNCPEKYQVKYATCTLLNSALTWWNSHKRTIRTEAAFAMSWRELMKLMAEIFQELTMMCTKMVPKEEDRVEKFIGGLPDNI